MKFRDVLGAAAVGLDALVDLGQIAEDALGRTATRDELLAILAGVAGVARSISGDHPVDVTQAVVQSHMDGLRQSIASNNAAVDAQIQAKFPK